MSNVNNIITSLSYKKISIPDVDFVTIYPNDGLKGVYLAREEYLEGNPGYLITIDRALNALYPDHRKTLANRITPHEIARIIVDQSEKLNKRVIVVDGERATGKSTTAYYVAEGFRKKGLSVCVLHLDDFFNIEERRRFDRLYIDNKDADYPPAGIIALLFDLQLLIELYKTARETADVVIVEGLFSSDIITLLEEVGFPEVLTFITDLPYEDHILFAAARDFISRSNPINPSYTLRRYESFLKNSNYRRWISSKIDTCDIACWGSHLSVVGIKITPSASEQELSDPIFERILKAKQTGDISFLESAYDLALQFNYGYLADSIRSLIEKGGERNGILF